MTEAIRYLTIRGDLTKKSAVNYVALGVIEFVDSNIVYYSIISKSTIIVLSIKSIQSIVSMARLVVLSAM